MRILITAPSLDEDRNVSGISTIVKQIIDNGSDDYSHFIAGSADGEGSGIRWSLKQVSQPFAFAARILSFRPDVVHINTALTERSILRDAALSTVAKLMGKRLAVSVHGGKYLIDDIRSKSLASITRDMLSKADDVIVYSDFERQHLHRRWPELKCHTLANAIPSERIGSADRDNDPPVLIYLGRMHESKGLQELKEACRTLVQSGFKFTLKAYGEGPLRVSFVSEMTSDLGDAFIYGGIVKSDEKWPILSTSDIFVLPSRYGEGLPMAMLEAMARGCIVVVADVASVSTVVHDGSNGFLVKPCDAAGLASKIKVILSDQRSWPDIRAAAESTIRENFEIKGYIEKLGSIYRKAATGDRP